jgi:acetate kinase
MKKEGLDADGVDKLMNKESGVYGMTGISSDFRDIEDAAAEGNQLAINALDAYAQRVKKYIGAYAAEMNGVDAIVFTAGLGENGIGMREMICADMDFMGIKLDPEKNDVRGKDRIISSDDSRVKVLLIPTNEELMIARDTLRLSNR